MASDQKTDLAKDPVCGMSVDSASAKAKAEHAGKTYYFCCTGCAEKFHAAPEEYLKAKPRGLVTRCSPPPHGPHLPLVGISASSKPVDPVCGMALNPQSAEHHVEHSGSTYFFCSASCLEKFKATPKAYLTSRECTHSQVAQQAMAPSSATTAYVCPMCPEVRESKPMP